MSHSTSKMVNPKQYGKLSRWQKFEVDFDIGHSLDDNDG